MPHSRDIIAKDEKIVEVVRPHWINFAPIILSWVTLFGIVLVGFYILGRYSTQIERIGPIGWLFFILIALIVLASLLAYAGIWVFRENRLIITDKNIYQVTQRSLFNRKILQFALERLQDVTAAQKGFFANAMDYGDVTVETAGEEENFALHNAPRPRDLAHRIMECHRAAVDQLKAD